MRLIAPIQEHTEELQGGKKSRSAPDVATGLTDKQEAFCQAIMGGATFADGYRAAYCADGMVPNSIWNAASRLAADAKVRGRLEQLAEQREAERRMLALSRADWVIERITQQVMDPATPPAAKTRALELLGKTIGLFTDRVETKDISERSADDIEADIRARLHLT
ncbi:MAG: hypothetical protein WAO78_00635 [Roseovarius sp.]